MITLFPKAPFSNTSILQVASYVTGAVASGTGVIPDDDTIPQITEGNEYMLLAFTPRSASSTLLIEVNAMLSSSGSAVGVVCALFADAVANALASGLYRDANSNQTKNIAFSYAINSVTVDARTYRVRAGSGGASTTTFNGAGLGARLLGGVASSSIIITEFETN